MGKVRQARVPDVDTDRRWLVVERAPGDPAVRIVVATHDGHLRVWVEPDALMRAVESLCDCGAKGEVEQ